MVEVVVSSRAYLDFLEALRWYLDRSVSAALAFEAEYQKGLELIETHPYLRPTFNGLHRRHGMKKFPYQIIYFVENNRATVVAIVHGSRDPDAWLKRSEE